MALDPEFVLFHAAWEIPKQSFSVHPSMSGRSTPKRPLEADGDDDSWREVERLNLKRYQHEMSSGSISASRSSSRSSYGKASSLDIASEEATPIHGGVSEAPPKSC